MRRARDEEVKFVIDEHGHSALVETASRDDKEADPDFVYMISEEDDVREYASDSDSITSETMPYDAKEAEISTVEAEEREEEQQDSQEFRAFWKEAILHGRNWQLRKERHRFRSHDKTFQQWYRLFTEPLVERTREEIEDFIFPCVDTESINGSDSRSERKLPGIQGSPDAALRSRRSP